MPATSSYLQVLVAAYSSPVSFSPDDATSSSRDRSCRVSTSGSSTAYVHGESFYPICPVDSRRIESSQPG